MLVQLAAQDFRNLAPLTWQPEEGQHLLLGDNGAGKTSVLEAVYTLATTRSFRAPRLADCCRHGTTAFQLSGEVQEGRGASWTRLDFSVSEGQRQRWLNGSAVSLSEHLAALPVIAWTSADSEILSGPPEVRRRFLDRGVLGRRPAALADLGRYRRALAQKRELLQQGSRAGVLESWNAVLATAATAVITARRRYVELLRGHLQTLLPSLDLDFPPVTLQYRPSPGSALQGEDPQTLEGILFEALQRRRGEEVRRGIPLVGPHRDDLEVRWDDHRLRRVASAGERKTIGLALLAAHGRVLEGEGRDPLYLLDDADTELSESTLHALWPAFRGARQLFASSNRPEVWRDLSLAGRWHLTRGSLEEL
jgi:DNA replication and repair protein RecF